MKKQFIAKGQTRFNTPVVSFLKNGSVRKYTKTIKLSVGSQVVKRNISEQTDEGYNSVYELWENDKGVLYRVIHTDSSDCDGRYSSVNEQKLVDGSWVKVKENQRDYRAESMGY